MRTFNSQTETLPAPNKIKTEDQEIKIFLVDDDKSYLYALGFHLKKEMKYKIFCYETGEECLKNLYLNPDIIVLDYYLNGSNPDAINGLETLKSIKRRKSKTKIIMLSGQETLAVAASSLKIGAFTYVIKDLRALYVIKKLIDEICGEESLPENFGQVS